MLTSNVPRSHRNHHLADSSDTSEETFEESDGDCTLIRATTGAPRGWTHPPEVNALEATSVVHRPRSIDSSDSTRTKRRSIGAMDTPKTIPKRNMSILAIRNGEFFAILRVRLFVFFGRENLFL